MLIYTTLKGFCSFKVLQLLSAATVYAQYMNNICTVYVQYMYSLCTVYVQYMYSICTVYVQHMYSICTVYIQYMYSIETAHSTESSYLGGRLCVYNYVHTGC